MEMGETPARLRMSLCFRGVVGALEMGEAPARLRMSLCFRGVVGAFEMGEAPARLRMSLGFLYKCGQSLRGKLDVSGHGLRGRHE